MLRPSSKSKPTATNLEGSQEGGEDIDLDTLLPSRLGLTNTLLEVRQQLLAMLRRHRGKSLPEQQSSRVDHRDPQGEGVGGLRDPLRPHGHVDRVGIVLECPGASR